MVFQKRSQQNWQQQRILEPDAKYYLHLIFEAAIKAPTDSLENPENKNLNNAWAVVDMCAYQAEVFGWVKNLVDVKSEEYKKMVEDERERLNQFKLDTQVLNAKLGYFKLAYVLKKFEKSKPDVIEGEIFRKKDEKDDFT